MSLFTTSKLANDKPVCPRCRSAKFVVLVRQGEDNTVWNCKSCPVPTKQTKQQQG